MEIVTIADHPALAATVAGWLWHAFGRYDGRTPEDEQTAVAESVSRRGPPQTFVLLDGGVPVGTASLHDHDLDERPALTPWLAGVFVLPQARGRGGATRLVGAVEAACVDAGIPAAWLYTHTAGPLYSRLGWQAVEIVEREDKPAVTVMRREFFQGRAR